MAGKELKATEKTVLKHSREGVLEQNLSDGSAKKVSNKAEEAVLKTAIPDDERFDKLKAAGLVVEDVKKPDHRKLQFGRNNPDNTWTEVVYGNKPAEQLSFISDEKYQNSETSIPVTAEEFAEMRQTPFKAEELKDFDFSKTRLKHSFCSDDEYTTSDEVVEATAEDLKPKSKLSFKSDNEYVNSEEAVEIDGAEFVGQQTEEKTESKLKEKKTRKGLKDKSSAAEKLSDKDGNSVFYYEGEAPPDRKLTHGEKKLKRRIRKDEKKVYKLQKRLDKAEDKLPHQRVFHVRKEWNYEKQKMQRKLKLEKEVKPLPKPNIVQKGVQGAKYAVTTAVSGTVHQQISKPATLKLLLRRFPNSKQRLSSTMRNLLNCKISVLSAL